MRNLLTALLIVSSWSWSWSGDTLRKLDETRKLTEHE